MDNPIHKNTRNTRKINTSTPNIGFFAFLMILYVFLSAINVHRLMHNATTGQAEAIANASVWFGLRICVIVNATLVENIEAAIHVPWLNNKNAVLICTVSTFLRDIFLLRGKKKPLYCAQQYDK